MNNNDDFNNPITAIHALSELARANGLAPRELIMDCYESLSDEQQKDLPVAAFNVDATDHNAPVRSEFFDVHWTRDSLIQALWHQRDIDDNLDQEASTATQSYINEYLTDYSASDPSYSPIDTQAVQGALDLGPMPANQPEPTPAVRAVLDELYLSESDGYRQNAQYRKSRKS